MDTTLHTDTNISFHITAIKGNGFPKIGRLGYMGSSAKYYVTVVVNGETKKTAALRSDAPNWNETFTFTAPAASSLRLCVFTKRLFGSDDYIGGMEESIGFLPTPTVIERALETNETNVARPTQAQIQFVFRQLNGGLVNNEFGVHVLQPGVNPVVDIVAIHGLDGNLERSWTADNGTLWLRDLLPMEVPHARILTYGYDAYTRGRDQLANESIHDLANDLLSSLATRRRISHTERRPIIFVAHSLGGIILKSALLLANLCGEHHNFHHKSIELSTYGLIFLGTPHQGAENINFALLLLHIQAIYTPTTDIIVKDIELHSKVLQEQLDRYKAISHKYATIFCYEKYPTKLFTGKRLVDQYSAVIPGMQNAESVGLNKDHVSIAKFERQEDWDFTVVASHLSQMAGAALSKIAKTWESYKDDIEDGRHVGNETRLLYSIPPAPLQVDSNLQYSKQNTATDDMTSVPIPAASSSLTPNTLLVPYPGRFIFDHPRVFQDYWHSPYVLRPPHEPASTLSDKDIQQFRNRADNHTLHMENKLAGFVHQYRNAMLAEVNLFPHPDQQRAVFRLMMSAADGLIHSDPETRRTLLHYMAMNGVTDILKSLVDAGFGVDDGDSDYRTPLHLAVVSNHADAVRILVETCGADVHVQDLKKLLPWHCALNIDCDYLGENFERIASKEQILRLLAVHTDPEKVQGPRFVQVLKNLKENPGAAIEIQLRRNS